MSESNLYASEEFSIHRHSQGSPQGKEKKLGEANLQGKVVSALPGRECTPQGRARVQFFEEIGEIWMVGEVI